MMWGLGYGGWGSSMGWLGPVFMIAIWALIITGGVFLPAISPTRVEGGGTRTPRSRSETAIRSR